MLLQVIFIIACTQNAPNKQLVASTETYFLFQDDLIEIQPEFKDSLDSINWVQAYVDNWIKEALILEKAKFNLQENRTDFEKELKEYENSLLKHKYELELVKNYLDTIVTKEELASYYDQNKDNFLLLDYLIQAYFIVLDKDLDKKKKDKIKKIFRSKDKENWTKLEKLCIDNNAEFELFDSTWHKWEEFSGEFDLEINKLDSWLRYNDFIDYSDTSNYYLIRIENYKLKNEISPLRFEEEKIKQIILHQRKLELIKRMEKEIFEEAKEKGKFKRY